jgi:hypothetical protein
MDIFTPPQKPEFFAGTCGNIPFKEGTNEHVDIR